MVALAPVTEVGPASLDDRKATIISIIEGAAIDVGDQLIRAKAEHPGEFMAWVEAELPFGIDKAERLMAVTRAFGSARPEVLAALPPAYSTLFELARMPTEHLNRAIDEGKVNPEMTYRQASDLRRGNDEDPPGPVDLPPPSPSPTSQPRIAADVIARELMRFPRSQLSGEVEVALRRWMA